MHCAVMVTALEACMNEGLHECSLLTVSARDLRYDGALAAGGSWEIPGKSMA